MPDNRSALLDYSLSLFAAKGYDAVGVQQIVEAASGIGSYHQPPGQHQKSTYSIKYGSYEQVHVARTNILPLPGAQRRNIFWW